MRKTKLATYAVALTLAAAAMTGISTETAHADESGDAHYNINENGGTWDGTHYTLNGQVITNAFFCDGTYTYYLQADGTPMKNRLTYHPDGEHVIFFDADGHEVFSNFANVKQSIAGNPVDDLCFFNVYGYMYVNKLTYDQSGQNLYYINEYGVMERGNRWFQFPWDIEDVDGKWITVKKAYGFATENGSLLTNAMTYDWNGQQVYLQGNGMIAKGLTNIGGTWYMFDVNDGHFVQAYSSKPETYTYTYYTDDYTTTETYNGDGNLLSSDVYNKDGVCTYHVEATYDAAGKLATNSYYGIKADGTLYSGSCTYNARGVEISSEDNYQYYNDELINVKHEYNALTYASGSLWYSKSVYYANGVLQSIHENYYADSDNGQSNGNKTASKDSHYNKGVLYNTIEQAYDSEGTPLSRTEKYYDADGNITGTYVKNY